jgi:putative ABC transport system ATP-binding protein
MENKILKIEDIFVVFFSGSPLERVALRGINFDVKEGEVVSILGNNGSGKSTLLKFLAGHILANFGRIWHNKEDITSHSISERSKIFSSVFYDQNVGSAGNLTVLENLSIASMHHQNKSLFYPAITKEIKEIFYEQLKELDFMGMDMLIDEKVNRLSKLQRHVLSILIAVIKEAKILLIDEHSTGLDKESSEALLEVTKKIVKSKNITTVMAVNDPKFALDVSDRLLVLSHGQIVLNLDSEDKNKKDLNEIFYSFNIVPPIKEFPNTK